MLKTIADSFEHLNKQDIRKEIMHKLIFGKNSMDLQMLNAK